MKCKCGKDLRRRSRKCEDCRRQTRSNGVWRRKILRKFGVTVGQYNTFFESQGGFCAICKDPPKPGTHLCVDTDSQGNLRGLLCPGCKRALGSLEPWILGAVEYLGIKLKTAEKV